MSNRVGSTSLAVARRYVMSPNPAQIVPPLLLPLIFFAAFAGGLSSVSESPGFDYPDYTGFIWVFVLMMGVSFVAAFNGFGLAADLESGFSRRLMLASPRWISIVLGGLIVSLVQCVFEFVVLFLIGLAAGMEIGGSVPQVAVLFVLALLLNVAMTFFAAGVGLLVQKVQTGSVLMIMPMFVLLFISPVYLPRAELSGWLKHAADYNPVTALLEAGRGLLAGQPESVGLAFAAVAALIVIFLVFAVTGLRGAGSK
jgi:ABC-2 type transport system permease protein